MEGALQSGGLQLMMLHSDSRTPRTTVAQSAQAHSHNSPRPCSANEFVTADQVHKKNCKSPKTSNPRQARTPVQHNPASAPARICMMHRLLWTSEVLHVDASHDHRHNGCRKSNQPKVPRPTQYLHNPSQNLHHHPCQLK